MSKDLDIKEVVAGIEGSFADLKSELATIKGKQDSYDEEKLTRITDDITKNLEQMQAEQQKMKAAMERQEKASEAGDDIEAKHAEQFNSFLRDIKSGKDEIEVRSMSTDANPDGGYLVRPQFVNKVVDRVFETSPIRLIADTISGSSKSIELLIDDNEAGAGWIGEGGTVSETDTPQIGIKEIVAHKAYADPKLSEEMIQDSAVNIEQWLQSKVGDRIGRLENTAFVNGDGVGKPRGFLTYAAGGTSYTRGQIQQYNLGATSLNATATDGLIQLQAQLKEPYQSNAVFGMKRASYGAILTAKGADTHYFGATLLRDGQAIPTLLGKQVVLMDDMPAEASAALAVVYGDFTRGYTIYDRVGLQVLRDPYSTKGFVEYYVTKRTGGDVTNFDAIKIGKLSA
jgi:HK97 family phage major capsid protein